MDTSITVGKQRVATIQQQAADGTWGPLDPTFSVAWAFDKDGGNIQMPQSSNISAIYKCISRIVRTDYDPANGALAVCTVTPPNQPAMVVSSTIDLIAPAPIGVPAAAPQLRILWGAEQ